MDSWLLPLHLQIIIFIQNVCSKVANVLKILSTPNNGNPVPFDIRSVVFGVCIIRYDLSSRIWLEFIKRSSFNNGRSLSFWVFKEWEDFRLLYLTFCSFAWDMAMISNSHEIFKILRPLLTHSFEISNSCDCWSFHEHIDLSLLWWLMFLSEQMVFGNIF